MPWSRWAVRLMSVAMPAGLLLGCQSAPKPEPAPPPPPPASSTDVAQVQMDLQQHDKGARAGSVIKVDSANHLAAVVMATAPEAAPIRVDDPFTFTDSKQNPIANGKVISMENGIVVVSYVPVEGGREPAAGDIAIHIPM